MPNKVFEGSAELNIQQFLDALKKMEDASGLTASNIDGIFKTLDQSIQTTLGGIQKYVNSVAQQISGVGAVLSGAQAQVAQGQQQIAQQAQQANQQAAQAQSNLRQMQQAGAQALQTTFQQELAMRRQYNQEDERLLRDKSARDLQNLKLMGTQEAAQLQQSYTQQRQIVERQLAEMQRLKAEAYKQQNGATGEKNNLLGAGPAPADLAQRLDAVERSYQQGVNAARMAEQEEASLQRQLTQITEVERKAQLATFTKQRASEKELNEKANRDFVNGFKGAWEQAKTDFRKNVQDVEDQWNSVFRAGSQLSSIGGQLTMLSGVLTALGAKLTTNAGDFDFWSRRTVAAAKAANDSLYEAFGGTQQQTIETFNDHILELGRGLGTLKPAEVAQSWYLYQAAMGEAITTQDQLVASQNAVDSILKAAIVSDTNYETAIRGVTQAMAEFGLGQDQAAYATQVMLNLTQTSQAEFSDVLEAYKMVGPQAARLGMDLAETSAVMARLSDNGIKGSSAGRALSMALTTLIDPSDKASDALQDLFVTQQHLTGSWRDIIFKGGDFIGMLSEVDAKTGQVHKGFLEMFAQATKGMSEVQRQSYLAAVFSQNATKILIPLVGEYADAVANGNDKTATGKKRMEELQAEFRNATLQASLFGDQWKLVSESIKVRLGQATYGIQEALVRLGYVVAETFLPIVEWVNKAINKFLQFGETHPYIVRGLVSMAAALAVVAAVAGPVLIMMGQVLQVIASWQVAAKVISESSSLLAVGLRGIGVSVAGLAGPFLIVIAILGALYLAWKTNFLGMGEILGQFFGALQSELAAITDLIEGVFALISAIISGDKEKIQAALREIAVAFIEAFLVLPNQMAGALQSISNTIIEWAGSAFGSLAENLAVWGYNLMMSLVNGIYEGASAVWAAAESVAEGIAMYFRSFSPPKHGPLRGIFVWGRNLIGTLLEGMTTADISAVDEIAGKIGDALQLAIKTGDTDASVYAQTMEAANGKIAEMIDIVKGGGRVNEEFFAPLRENLGAWYDQVVDIALAYQDVYAAQNALDIEKEKLEVIKQQRQELDAQNKARQTAFDRILGKDDPNSAANPEVQAQMVDPTTEEGKAKIEQMRRTLSKEDFQNWINWQRKLWEQQHDAQDSALQTQEDAQQTAVDALTKQLELAKGQYDYFVKIFEYAQKMLKLQEEQDRLEKSKDPEQANKLNPAVYGTPEDLAAARKEIAGAVGADGQLLDEGTLKANRGGDDVGALADAGKQREAEENRLSDLEKLNRKKRADFEAQLIAATSDEERKRIKQQKDAWDAAYKDEKARLQERIAFSKEVEDAAKKEADATKAARESIKEKEYQEEIKKLLGDQTDTIKDANELKAGSKDLNEAELKAKQQLQSAEHEVNDLRALDKQKQLDFEQRIREAGNDPEKVRRIKEEKEAWDTAYKSALATAQARAEAARRVQQELQNEDTANGPDGAGAKGPKGFEAPVFPAGGVGAPPAPPAWMSQTPDWLKNPPKPIVPEAPRQSKLEAEGMFDNLKRGIDFLNNKSVDTKTKLYMLGEAVKEAFGWKTWWDALAPEQTREKLRQGWNRVVGGLSNAWEGVKTAWNGFWADLDGKWQGFKNGVTTSWNGFWDGVGQKWEAFKTGFEQGWSKYWDDVLKPVYFFVGLVYVLWVTIKDLWSQLVAWFTESVATPFTKAWNDFWTGIQTWWTQNVSQPFTTGWNSFWSGLTSWWTENVSTPFTASWNGFWNGLTGWWKENVSQPFTAGWNQFWTDAKQKWDSFKSDVSTAWTTFWSGLKTDWETFKRDLSEAWAGLWAGLQTAWAGFKTWIDTTLKPAWDGVKTAFEAAMKPINEGWDGLVTKISGWYSSLSSFVSNLETTINRIISIGRSILGMGKGSGGEDKKPDGSNANGLYSVPFDGYLSELHQGERVLTKAEAALYNSVEKFGLLGVLNALAGSATARVSQATAPATQQVTNVKMGDKTVNVNVDRIDATNPDEGKAFLHKLAFLG